MAVAVTVNDRGVMGNRYSREVTLAFSGTYTTGGEAPTNGFLKELGFASKVTHAAIQGGGGAAVGVIPEYDYATNKVKLFRTDQIDDFQEEVPNGTSLTGVSLRAWLLGI